jgi:hypothetical protein
MSFYLLDHPPTSRQFYPSRSNAPTFAVGVHTSEGPTGPGSARNLASFIARRSDPGSYACIVDSDETIFMVPADYTTFSVAASGYNSRTWHVCLAGRSADLSPDDANTQAMIARAGAAIRDFWNSQGIALSNAEWIGTEALSRPGLFCHGDVQPWDRSDAWSLSPDRGRLDQMLTDAIAPTSPPAPKGSHEMISLLTMPDGRGVEFRAIFGTIFHRWQKTVGGSWTDWSLVNAAKPPSIVDSVSARVASGGALELLAWNSVDGTTFRTWQLRKGSSWSGWSAA